MIDFNSFLLGFLSCGVMIAFVWFVFILPEQENKRMREQWERDEDEFINGCSSRPSYKSTPVSHYDDNDDFGREREGYLEDNGIDIR